MIALLMPVAAFAQDRHEEWLQCQSDDDCVKTQSVCDCNVSTDEAVNKDYLDDYNDWASQNAFCRNPPKFTFNPNAECQYVPLFGPNAVAKCISMKCFIAVPGKQE